MLTHQDVMHLTAYFLPDEHEFLKGMTYITEGAITRRIETVDPSWSLKIYDVRQREKNMIAVVQLTIKDVTRDGVGMSVIQYDKDTKSIEVNEAEKSAATDALKRAARLFGIGRYLLDLPSDVRDMKTLSQYLRSRPNATPRADIRIHDRTPTSAPETAQTDVQGENTAILKTSPVGEMTIKRKDANSKPYAVIAGVTFFSGELLRAAGFDMTSSEWKTPGKYPFPDGVKVVVGYHMDGEYKVPASVEIVD